MSNWDYSLKIGVMGKLEYVKNNGSATEYLSSSATIIIIPS
jgi:hypothetical protein